MFKSASLGFLSRSFSVLSNIIIIPLILKHLTANDFSLWMLFISFYSLVIIFDFGFSSTISRYLSFILSGVTLKQLYKDENPEEKNKGNIDFQAMQALIRINSYIFNILALFAVIVLSLVYMYYDIIVKLELSSEDKIAWLIFSSSIFFQLISIKYNGYLHGSGNVSRIYRNTIFSTVIFFVLAFLFIDLQFPLVGLCLARAISSLAMLILNASSSTQLNFIRQIKENAVHKDGIDNRKFKILFKIIRSKSLLLGLGGLGNFICNRTTIIVLTSVVAMDNIAGVSFVINLSITILSVSLILINNAIPNLVQYRSLGQHNKLFSLFYRVVVLSICFYSFSYILMVTALPELIKFTNSKIIIPNVLVLFLCFFIFLIELIQSLSMCFIATSNNVSFTKYQFVTGIMFLLICATLSYFGHATLINILLTQLAVQCIYNAWKWPLIVYLENVKVKHLTIGFK